MIYAELDEFGCPVTFGQGSALPEGKTEVPVTHIIEARAVYLVDGLWVQRPTLPAHSIGPALTVVCPGCPAGTVVEATQAGYSQTITGAGDLALTMPEAGAYWIDILPPRPTMTKRFRVELAE
jgi:hypothetical protein